MKITNFLMLAMVALLLQSCAFMRDHINVEYYPTSNCEPINGAELQYVNVSVFDQRPSKERVGRKMNGYGMEMASIMANNDVADLLQQAITLELKERGFKIGMGQKELLIYLNKFNNNFKPGFFTSSAVSEAILNVQLKDKEGRIVYANTIFGHGKENCCFLNSGKNAKIALDLALQDAIYKLLNDSAFIDALIQ